ncbi:hypothetical protein X975_11196, partial [Stegodyphus mimosarum]
MVEKHAQQLMALTDDLDEEDDTTKEDGEKRKISQTSKTTPKPSKLEERGRIGSSGDEPAGSTTHTVQRHMTMNGTVPKQASVGSSSPGQVKSQDTARRPNQPVSSISEDTQEKPLSLLESEEANITAESLDIVRQHKLVQKITNRLEKELQALKKKQERIREREVDVLQAKEAKLLRSQEHTNIRTHNRFVR